MNVSISQSQQCSYQNDMSPIQQCDVDITQPQSFFQSKSITNVLHNRRKIEFILAMLLVLLGLFFVGIWVVHMFISESFRILFYGAGLVMLIIGIIAVFIADPY